MREGESGQDRHRQVHERHVIQQRERQTPRSLEAPSPAPASATPAKTMQGMSPPSIVRTPSPSTSQAEPALPFPRGGFAQEEKKSAVPLILLGLLITLGIGGGGFYFLYKTQLEGSTTSSSKRDAGAATTDGSAK